MHIAQPISAQAKLDSKQKSKTMTKWSLDSYFFFNSSTELKEETSV